MSNAFTYRFEFDPYQDCIERITRKIAVDGEEALTLALKERGYEKVVRCRDCRSYRASDATCHAWQWSNWDEAVEVDPDGFCAWGERKAVS